MTWEEWTAARARPERLALRGAPAAQRPLMMGKKHSNRASLAALSEGGTAAPDGTQTTNAWAVDMTTGKVSVNFFGDINLQGNRILDAAKNQF